jgi:A/G-specific adenine glycosylase
MNTVEKLMHWYGANKRDLPWRRSKDPYRIWLSEIILQQTRVNQGMDYYLRFVDKYPDIKALAAASEQEILKMWQGLGYYSRARNMLATARDIQENHGGRFPDSYDQIIKFKGIGPYTAGAVASIAFDEPFPVIDGNVKRVITRLFGIHEPVNTSKAVKRIEAILQEMIDRKNPGDFNQALMEFGAIHCKPQKPLCEHCPLSHICKAKLNNEVDKLPVIQRKTKPESRSLNYIVMLSIRDDEVFFLMRKRTGKDIWKNMYDFPLLEDGLFDLGKAKLLRISSIYKHQLSHQQLIARFNIYRYPSPVPPHSVSDSLSRVTRHGSRDLLPVSIGDLHQYPIPRLIDRFIRNDLMPEIKKYQE